MNVVSVVRSLVLYIFLQVNRTALHWGGSKGDNNIVTFLLSHGARVNDVDWVS